MTAPRRDNDGEHLPLATIIECALQSAWHPHLHACAFCREQYDEAALLLASERRFAAEPDDPAGERERAASSASSELEYEHAYRLAAMTPGGDGVQMRLRRTWYLGDGAIIVRVFEHVGDGTLVGFVLSNPDLYPKMRIVFSGLPREFRPDESGKFDIGPMDTDIEPMNVTISTD